jgi:hypothetical protein
LTPSADELVGDGDAFLRIRTVVADRNRDALADDAASGVDVLDGLLDAVLQLGAEGCVRAGDRPGNAELDLGVGPRSKTRGPRRARCRSTAFSSWIPSPLFDYRNAGALDLPACPGVCSSPLGAVLRVFHVMSPVKLVKFRFGRRNF